MLDKVTMEGDQHNNENLTQKAQKAYKITEKPYIECY